MLFLISSIIPYLGCLSFRIVTNPGCVVTMNTQMSVFARNRGME